MFHGLRVFCTLPILKPQGVHDASLLQEQVRMARAIIWFVLELNFESNKNDRGEGLEPWVTQRIFEHKEMMLYGWRQSG
jgi:hypothetical protein